MPKWHKERLLSKSADSEFSKILQHTQSMDSKYKCSQVLGKGAYGTVYLGSDQENQKQVAIKRVKTNANWARDNVDREIWYLAQCRGQQNLCQMEAAYRKIHGLESKRPQFDLTYIVMEAYEGSLLSCIQNPDYCLSFEVCADHLSRGLMYLHERHIIHRDLSSNNIFIRRQPEDGQLTYVIGDFGLARQFPNGKSFREIEIKSDIGYCQPTNNHRESILQMDDDETQLTALVTTKEYRAPEIFLHSKEYNCSIDAWSVGVILYLVLTRKHPFAIDRGKTSSYDVFKKTIWPHFNTIVTNPYRREAPLDASELPLLADIDAPIELIEETRPTVLQRLVLSSLLRLAPNSRTTMRQLRAICQFSEM